MKARAPRSGSMQFWPRKRAARPYARVRSFPEGAGLLAFAGYKMGMTHVQAIDTQKTSITKNETVSLPVTLVECPPMRVYSVRGYELSTHGLRIANEVIFPSKDKHLGRKVSTPKSSGASAQLDSFSSFADIRVLLITQPSKTGIGQKKPQIFEVGIGGKTAEEKLAVVKELVDKDIKASDIFKEGDYLDAHAVTKAFGTQGPVKRFGIGLKQSKSEKGRRRPGSLGGWTSQQHVMYRTAQAGQTGGHQRVQYNNQILKITENPEEIQVAGGFPHYGVGRQGNEFLVVRGSLPGTTKRLVTLVKPLRLKKGHSLPTIEAVNLDSNQGK